jgi:hypothetical protein
MSVLRGLLLVLWLSFSWPTWAQNSSTLIYLNEQPLTQLEAPFVSSGMLFLPVRLLNHLGLRVELDAVQHSVRLIRPGVFYQLRENSRQVSWNQQGIIISHAPIWQQDTLFIPRSLLANLGIGFSYQKQNNEIRIRQELNTLKMLQVEPTQVYTRLNLEFTQSPSYYVQESDERLLLEFYGMEVPEPEQFMSEVNDVLFRGVRIVQQGRGVTRIEILKKYASPHRLFWFEKPDRLRIDLIKVFQEEKTSQLQPGVTYTRTYQGLPFGPVTYHLLTVSPEARFELEPELAAAATGFGKEPVSAMARRRGAIAAINAGYFNQQGMPLGLLVKAGELIASPIYGRTLLGITRERRLFIDQTDQTLAVAFPGQNRQPMRFHAVNLPRQRDQVVLYTSRYGARTGTRPDPEAIELQVLSDGTVQQMGVANLAIPADGYVISAQGQSARWLKAQAFTGMRALIYSQLLSRWENLFHLMGGGPRLLRQGQMSLTAEQERFRPDITQGRAPRTAFGIGRQGEWLLLVADGRQRHSKGLTLTELAQLLKEKGAWEALNFDGGGSSAMVIGSQVVNQPSDGQERPVASALLLLKR